jgi:hypothetical protein
MNARGDKEMPTNATDDGHLAPMTISNSLNNYCWNVSTPKQTDPYSAYLFGFALALFFYVMLVLACQS